MDILEARRILTALKGDLPVSPKADTDAATITAAQDALLALSQTLKFDGTTWARAKIPDQRADLDYAAFTAGEVKTLFTPTAGKKWRIHYLSISVSGNSQITIQDSAGTPQIYDEINITNITHLPVDYGDLGLLCDAVTLTLDIKSSAAVSVGVHALVGEE